MKIKKILLDMDGVLVNYDKQVDLLDFRKPETGKTDWNKTRKMGHTFWSTMEWMPEGKEFYNKVVEFAKTVNVEVGILSAIFLAEGKVGKYIWLTENIPEMQVGNIILNDRGSDKYKVLPDDCVLIDDNNENVMNCLLNNKNAILYTNIDETMQKIKEYFNK